MEKQICLNGTWNDDKYSSPMPTIGLYIAAGTSACLLFMVCDLFHGLYNRKPSIPCRFFPLNSITLTLLAIASKLPLDLTTTMPSVQDQFSKLSGTTLICISMSFFYPSLGIQRYSERLSNKVSLTIFVITVVVNICMQLVTGVIYLFIVEHIIIMAFMLLLLALFWSTFDAFLPLNMGDPSSNPVDELVETDPQNSETMSMIQKLKSFFVSSCIQNPELDLCISPACLRVCTISICSLVVLLQAALRSLVLKKVEFRCGVSDYKWSMWMVVVTQIVTILVGSIATIFRWLLTSHETEGINYYNRLSTLSKLHIFLTWVLSTLSKLRIIAFFQISTRIFIITFLTISRFVLTAFFWIPCMTANKIRKIRFGLLRNGENMDHMDLHQCIQRNCEEDMNQWMEKYRSNSSIDHLIQLLSRTPISENPFTNQIQCTLSCLSVVIFIRIATFALPNARSASLVRTLDEAFGIIYFIDKKMNTTDKDKKIRAMAQELWMNRNNTCHWFHTVLIESSVTISLSDYLDQSSFQPQCVPQWDSYFPLGIREELEQRRQGNCIIGEQLSNWQIIFEQAWQDESSIYVWMEQLFVDMLHFFLSQFPLAIFKHLRESPIVEHEERARFVLKILCKLVPLENKVDWSFPDGSGITTLITTPVPSTHTQVHHSLADGTSVTQHIELVEGNADADVARQVINDDEIQELV